MVVQRGAHHTLAAAHEGGPASWVTLDSAVEDEQGIVLAELQLLATSPVYCMGALISSFWHVLWQFI